MGIDSTEPEWRDVDAAYLHLNVVIAYSDFSSATLARKILQDSVSALASEVAVRTSLWKFELLNSSALREIATQDAAEAQIIIIAADKEYGLPEAARAWVENCLTHPAVKDVAFMTLPREEEASVFSTLARLDPFEPFESEPRTELFWFITNKDEGCRLETEKIIELACQHPLGQQTPPVGASFRGGSALLN